MKKIDIYQIDTGIPIPPPERSGLPLKDLSPGESIAFPYRDRRKVQSQASFMRRRTGKKFIVRKQDKDIARIWRKE